MEAKDPSPRSSAQKRKAEFSNIEKKKLKRERKLARPNGQIAYDANVLWEDIRKKKIDKTKRQEAIKKLLELLKDGKLIDFARKRDTSHVIQSVLKYGTAEQRTVVYNNFKSHILKLSKKNYSHFLVIKLLKYGTKEQRDYIIKQFYGHVRNMVMHREASTVIEYAYIEYCNSEQRKALIAEFYGPEFSLFKDQNYSLQEILSQNPNKKTNILDFMRTYLFSLTNKPDMLGNSIVHKPLLQYLEYANLSQKMEMIEFMQQHVKIFLHTKDGSKAAISLIAYGKPKTRKVIVKSFKSYVAKICKEEFGHRVLLALFQNVDDTVLISSTIFKEMLKDASQLLTDKFGRLCFLAIIKGVTKHYFTPQTVSLLEPKSIPDPENSSKTIPTSKKEPEQRRGELLASLLPDITTLIKNPETMYEYITNFYSSAIVKEIVINAKNASERSELFQGILHWVNFSPALGAPQRKYHPLEKAPAVKEDLTNHSVAYITLEYLIKKDVELAEMVLDKICYKLQDYAILNNSAWVVLRLLQHEKTRNKVVKQLLPILDKIQELDLSAPKLIVKELEVELPAPNQIDHEDPVPELIQPKPASEEIQSNENKMFAV